MRALLRHNTETGGTREETLVIHDEAIVGMALLKRGETYFIFDGYLGGYAHTAVFTECPAPLTLLELNPKPAPRKFMGQKPKDETNG